jgi:hypothetical protein
MIGADIEPTDVVAHDDEDVGSALLLLLLRGSRRARHYDRCSEHPDQTKQNFSVGRHDRIPSRYSTLNAPHLLTVNRRGI